MAKKICICAASAIVWSLIALIVVRNKAFFFRYQELSSDGPRYIKRLSLSESKARLDSIGDKPVILFPPKNWDKVAAVARQLCLDVGGVGAVQTRSRHRGPPLGFSIFGRATLKGNDYLFCEFRFDFYDLFDSSVKLTAHVNGDSGGEYPGTLPKHGEEYLIKELARRLGISVDVPPGAEQERGHVLNIDSAEEPLF